MRPDEAIAHDVQALCDFFDGPSKWTQGQAARDKDGRGCNINFKGAVCWCLIGGFQLLNQSNKVDAELLTIVRDHIALYLKVPLGDNRCLLSNFNDVGCRSWDDMYAFLNSLRRTYVPDHPVAP